MILVNKNKYKIVGLFLNGFLPIKLPNISNYYKIIAVNGASNYLFKHNIVPDFVLGDMDSIDSYYINKYMYHNKIKFINTLDQNFTDFEKSIKFIIKYGFFNIDVWGGINGKENDHLLGNLFIAGKYINELSLIFYDKEYYIFFIKKSIKIYNVKNKKISFFPFPYVNNINSYGLKYNLKNKNFYLNNNIGIRNIAIKDNIKICFKKGILLLFIQR